MAATPVRFSKATLLSKKVAKAAPKGKKLVYHDSHEKACNLTLMVTATGSATFYFRFTSPVDRKSKRIPLGTLNRTAATYDKGMTVERARKLASTFYGQVYSESRDPLLEQQADAQAEKKSQAERAAMPTVERYFWDTFSPMRRRTLQRGKYKNEPDTSIGPKSWGTENQIIRDYVVPVFGNTPLDEVTSGMVAALAVDIGLEQGKCRTAVRAASILSVMYKSASKRGVFGESVQYNPTLGLWPGKIADEGSSDLQLIKKTATKRRQRFLSDEEIHKYLEACERTRYRLHRDLFLLLFHTGQRSDNMKSMRWDELDFATRKWTMTHGKTLDEGHVHTITLSREAIEILKARKIHLQWNIRKNKRIFSDYVFPSKKDRGTHIKQFWKAFKTTIEDAGLTDVTPHDIRRSLGSFLLRKKVELVVIQEIMGHSDINTTREIYALECGDERHEEAMDVVDQFVRSA